MPKHVARNRYLAVNGTAISDHCRSIEIEDTADEVELTGFTSNAYKEYGVGFKDATITAEVFADFDASQVHALLQPIYDNSSTCTVAVREDAGAKSATNPEASMVARLFSYSPIAGGVGDAAVFTATFRNAGTAGLTWATA